MRPLTCSGRRVPPRLTAPSPAALRGSDSGPERAAPVGRYADGTRPPIGCSPRRSAGRGHWGLAASRSPTQCGGWGGRARAGGARRGAERLGVRAAASGPRAPPSPQAVGGEWRETPANGRRHGARPRCAKPPPRSVAACETARPRCPQAWAAPPPAPHAATQMGSRRSGPAAARWVVAVSPAPPRPEATTGGGGPTCSGRCRASRHTRASSGARGNVVRACGGVRPTPEVDTQQLISRHRDFTCFC